MGGFEAIGEAMAVVAGLRVYKVEDGCAPFGSVWRHRGEKEWAATVVRDKAERGGVKRVFLARGARDWYRVAGLEAGDVVEVAADEINRKGRRTEHRAYRQILAVEEERILCRVVDEEDVYAGRVPAVPEQVTEPTVDVETFERLAAQGRTSWPWELDEAVAKMPTALLFAELARRGYQVQPTAA